MAKLGIDTLCQKSVEIWEPEDSTVSILFPNFIIKDLKAPSGMLLEDICPVLLQVPKYFGLASKLYIPSTPNNSNVTNTFMCLGRTGRFGQR